MQETLTLQDRVIYGPVRSRRLGASLGVNLSPLGYKLCSFSCAYCHYGWTKAHTLDSAGYEADLPTPEKVEEELKETLKNSPEPDYITFSGNGEPTLHPDFREIVERVSFLRDVFAPGAGIALISNSTRIDENMKEAFRMIDLKMMKLDCGDAETFSRFNQPCRGVEFSELLRALSETQDVVIQTMMVSGSDGNFDDESCESWIGAVSKVNPLWVQLYTIDGPTSSPNLGAVPHSELLELAELCRKRANVRIKVY